MTSYSARLRFVAILLSGVGAPIGSAHAQTTRPAHEPPPPVKVAAVANTSAGGASGASADAAQRSSWPGVVQQFVTSATAGNAESAWALVAPRARIDEFDPDAPATFAGLVQMADRATLLGVHPYETSPTTLAEDIASDVREVAAVPENVRKRMIPNDEDEAARANATAAQWLALNLEAEKGQPLATVVLWDAVESKVMFILLKGHKVPALGTFQITHAVFGDPLALSR